MPTFNLLFPDKFDKIEMGIHPTPINSTRKVRELKLEN
ncbi:hypothetical protein M595_3209 [Lyngbya aestuarii BL J]|uniref:Uncharacterized protein n=1 Tax=Lyngbya aestuarii BL J TaxID=1348334 RepID=U7QI70_9CYAN|nr:hypothetical protein M595_3209 [Lyngbya aestuarii BL J]